MKVLGWLVVGAGALFIAAKMGGDPAAPDRPSTPPPPLSASWRGAFFVLANDGGAAVDGCKVVLNGDYTADNAAVAAGGKTVIPFAQFADGAGRRFNILRLKLQRATVFCDGFDYKSFSFK